jgi:hypothetical protein
VKLSPEWQCWQNICDWARHVGIEPSQAIKREPDRCWFQHSWNMEAGINRLIEAGTLIPGNYKNHGQTAVAGWREARTRTAAQICLHMIDGAKVWEIDFDHWSPVDVVGAIGHAIEVVRGKLARKKTCPDAIAAGLRKRGINASSAV